MTSYRVSITEQTTAKCNLFVKYTTQFDSIERADLGSYDRGQAVFPVRGCIVASLKICIFLGTSGHCY